MKELLCNPAGGGTSDDGLEVVTLGKSKGGEQEGEKIASETQPSSVLGPSERKRNTFATN